MHYKRKTHLALLFRHPAAAACCPVWSLPPRGCCCSFPPLSFRVSAKLASPPPTLHTPAPLIGASLLPPACFSSVCEIFLKGKTVESLNLSKVLSRGTFSQPRGLVGLMEVPTLARVALTSYRPLTLPPAPPPPHKPPLLLQPQINIFHFQFI